MTLSQREISTYIAEKRGFTLTELRSRERYREIALARFICFHCIRTLTSKSLPEIGRFFSRDHTTVIHGLNQIQKHREADEGFNLMILNMIGEAKKACKPNFFVSSRPVGKPVFSHQEYVFGRKVA